MGHSASTYADFAECIASATDVNLRAAISRTAIVFDRATATWRWTMSIDSAIVAVSVRNYGRKIECARAAAQFTEIVRTTEPSLDEVRYIGAVLNGERGGERRNVRMTSMSVAPAAALK